MSELALLGLVVASMWILASLSKPFDFKGILQGILAVIIILIISSGGGDINQAEAKILKENQFSEWNKRVAEYNSSKQSTRELEDGFFKIKKNNPLPEWILIVEKIHLQIKEARQANGKPVFSDPFFVSSIMITESVPRNGDTINPDSKSSAGAYGPMQVLKPTALQMGCSEENWKEYYFNIRCGMKYLYFMADLFWEEWPSQNDQFYKLVAVGYHSGQGNVRAWMKQKFGEFDLPADVMAVIPKLTSNGKERVWGRVYPQRTYGIRTALHAVLTGKNYREKCTSRAGIQKYLKRPEETDAYLSHKATYHLACQIIQIPGVIYISGLNDQYHSKKFGENNRHRQGLALDLSVLPGLVDIQVVAKNIQELAPGMVTVKIPKCNKCTANHIHVEFKGLTVKESMESAEKYSRINKINE